MKKILLAFAIIMAGISTFAQSTPAKQTTSQYILIVRFKADFVPPSADAVAKNIKAWQDYMGGLAKSGKITGGYRPTDSGETITGTAQAIKSGPYIADNELVSSFIVVNAKDMDEARAIAKKCPVFEFNGSVEIRPLQETAR